MIGLKRGTVILHEYDPAWVEAYQRESERIKSALRETVFPFEHVGSTSIRGIHAKPIIDLIGGVDSIGHARSLIPSLEHLGYEYRANGDLPERILFVLGPEKSRTHHLSLVVRDGREWQNYLAFRDFLQNNQEIARKYNNLKISLATQFPNDRASYTAAKATFIQELLNSVPNV